MFPALIDCRVATLSKRDKPAVVKMRERRQIYCNKHAGKSQFGDIQIKNVRVFFLIVNQQRNAKNCLGEYYPIGASNFILTRQAAPCYICEVFA